MAGHSKWAQIKRQKAVNDQARGKRFAKIGREIAVAARHGGGDPDFNPRLRTAIANAKAENMPAANIDRAVQRGTGELPGMTFEETTYEGYGPGGVAIYLECVTDNTNRTVAEIRHLMSKGGGNLGQSGSVAWMFERKGQIYLEAERYDEEKALESALKAGAEDMRTEDGLHILTTSVADFHVVQDSLRDQGIEIEDSELAMIPATTVKVEGREAEKLLKLVTALEEQDDVWKLYSNFEVDDEAFASLQG
ncbi:MAG: YebC/PmpR family DNA-binding transcriptional regulator [Candidatus Palauibacterales bacterium]|nr:YebC/PmpR family DNA-binding transcriptional regulator [Candidatus Palauibacterales bacterium]MDP2483938.1 YebC/PmpR family DNA-binding transcriptional regulator [Candidatus Palauibacterales bacterium]